MTILRPRMYDNNDDSLRLLKMPLLLELILLSYHIPFIIRVKWVSFPCYDQLGIVAIFFVANSV